MGVLPEASAGRVTPDGQFRWLSASRMSCRAAIIAVLLDTVSAGYEWALSGPSGTRICAPVPVEMLEEKRARPKRAESELLGGCDGSIQTVFLITLRAEMNFGGLALSQPPPNTTLGGVKEGLVVRRGAPQGPELFCATRVYVTWTLPDGL